MTDTTTTDFEFDEDNSDADRRGALVARDPAGRRWMLAVEDGSATAAIHEFCVDDETDTWLAAMAPEEIKERLLSSRGLCSDLIREVSEGSWNRECGHWTRTSPLPAWFKKLLGG
jgi:hypothetical protein